MKRGKGEGEKGENGVEDKGKKEEGEGREGKKGIGEVGEGRGKGVKREGREKGERRGWRGKGENRGEKGREGSGKRGGIKKWERGEGKRERGESSFRKSMNLCIVSWLHKREGYLGS